VRLVQVDAEGIAGPVVPEREQVPRKASTPGGEVVFNEPGERPDDEPPALGL
jgi:hypothetical protein